MNLLLPILLAATAADATPEARAQEVLAQVQKAVGGASRLEAIKGLSLQAELRRVQPVDGAEARDMSGELTVDALLPDRYLRVETLQPFPGAPSFSIGTGLDGSEAWRAPIGNPGGGGGHVVVRVATGDGPGATAALLRRTRAELRRLLALALAGGPKDATLKLAYAGEAEAPEGRAHRIELSDAQGAIGTLFVDKATHRPLFVAFKALLPRMQMVRAEGPGDADRARREAEARGTAPAPAPEAEARLYVSDWKSVGGVLLPHRFSQTVEGGASEEWTVGKWTLDPALKPEHFKKQK
jgi:hypothetical protein